MSLLRLLTVAMSVRSAHATLAQRSRNARTTLAQRSRNARTANRAEKTIRALYI